MSGSNFVIAEQPVALAGESPTKQSRPVDGLAEILAWSAQCPAWQQDALRRLCIGQELEAADEAELLDILKGKKASIPLTGDHIRQAAKAMRIVTLKSIRNAENINALAPKQTLSFCKEGMTIVYGENGSGKSGYVRILKAACRARRDRAFDILPNVYVPNKGDPQTAVITYIDGTVTHSPQWLKGTATDPALSAITVFDTSAGTIHATGTNDILYTPFPIQVLTRLAKVAESLSAKLAEEIRQLERQIPPSVSNHECSAESETGRLPRALSAKTKTEDVDRLCLLSEEQKAELVGLRKDLADDPTAIATRNTRLAQRLESLSLTMASAASALNDDALRKITGLRQETASATQAARTEAERRFATDPLPVGNPAWEALWLAAQAYAEECVHPGQAFPQLGEGKVCVLCQRPHEPTSADRFRRFQAFVADELGKQIKASQVLLDQTLAFDGAAYLLPSKIVEIREYLTNVGESVLATKIRAFLVKAAWRYRWIQRAGNDNPHAAPALGSALGPEIGAAAESLRTKARVLQSAVTSPERGAMQARFDELADREWLAVVKDDVMKAIEVKREIATLSTLAPPATRTAITKKNTALAKELVTDRLRDSFANEVSKLGISRLRVELRQARL